MRLESSILITLSILVCLATTLEHASGAPGFHTYPIMMAIYLSQKKESFTWNF